MAGGCPKFARAPWLFPALLCCKDGSCLEGLLQKRSVPADFTRSAASAQWSCTSGFGSVATDPTPKQEHLAAVKAGHGICVRESRSSQDLSAELHRHLAAAFPIDLNSDAVQPGQGRAMPTQPHTCTPTVDCHNGEWMMIRLRHTSCCTLPRMTRLPRHHPPPPVGCQKAHTPSCSTTAERQL